MKLYAPSFIACTDVGMSPCAVTRITGGGGVFASASRITSSPSRRPSITRSVTTTSYFFFASRAEASDRL